MHAKTMFRFFLLYGLKKFHLTKFSFEVSETFDERFGYAPILDDKKFGYVSEDSKNI